MVEGSYRGLKDPVPSQEKHHFREYSAVLPHNTMVSMDIGNEKVREFIFCNEKLIKHKGNWNFWEADKGKKSPFRIHLLL